MLALGMLGVLLLGGCGLIGPDEVVVSAATSLTEAFDALEIAFEAEHTNVDIIVNLGGSQILAGQIIGGAPAALFASANPESVEDVQDAGLGLGDPVGLASNRLVIVVPRGNPDDVQTLADLPDLVVVLGAPEVPIGAYAREALQRAGVSLSPVSEEPDTRAVVARVAVGDADAGIAYSTDVAIFDEVEGIDLPADLQPDIRYEVLLLDDSASAFLEFLASPPAQAILRDAGFRAP